jgi:thioredoxin reductase
MIKLYDAIIIGAGIAGLNAAANFSKDKKVLVICKEIHGIVTPFMHKGV